LRSIALDRPGSAVAAVLLGLIALVALAAPLIAPQNPFDLSSFDVLDADLPPRRLAGSDPRFLLGTHSQGRPSSSPSLGSRWYAQASAARRSGASQCLCSSW
jgi:peptide/nickel transport system permease protein